MLGPVELQLVPSCYNCLAWSADGEIAVAAGEYVQILTPKENTENGDYAASSRRASGWHTSRFRANVFTSKEWPIMMPQKRDYFSVGREQSLSTVVGLAWSPPGLGKYRRCVLAVLTSNMLVSFYESVGPQGKWIRVSVINKYLKQYFETVTDSQGLRIRKASISSFSWCPPFKDPTLDQGTTKFCQAGGEGRWGHHLFCVATDDNEIVLLHARRSSAQVISSDAYSVDILSVTSIDKPTQDFPQVQPNSVFATMLKTQAKPLSISCGPWVYNLGGVNDHCACSAAANVAVLHGTKLVIIKFHLTLSTEEGYQQSQASRISVDCQENALAREQGVDTYHFTGPLQWLHMEGSDETYLAAGTLAGIVVVTFTSEAYHGVETSSQAVVHERMLETTADGTQIDERRHWEPASAITTVLDAETKTNILHFGTVGGYTLAMVPTLLHNEDSFFQPPWKHSFDDIRERFDIDRDLGGLAVGRLWGLASYGEFVVAAVTIQPGDMIEYRTATEERTTLIFSRARSQITELDDTAMHPTIPDRSADYLGAKRETVLGYILFFKDGKFDKQPWSHKILYATACCAIVESHDTDLLSQARKALKWLANKIPANLTEEINKCSTPGSTIGAKSAKELSGPGQLVFEKCEICDTGIAWYSGREAQCVEGHVFVRCGLTSLSIQDPGISKFCSVCATEYLNEDLVEASYGTDIPEATRILFDAFDTCIYCNGKFCA